MYILTYLPQTTTFSKLFWALSVGPQGFTPRSPEFSPRATYPGIFCRLHLKINKRFYSGTPNLQRHPYANTAIGSHSTGYVPQDLFPPLYLNFNISFYSGTPTSNVTPTPMQYSDSTPRLTYPTIFYRRYTSILTKGFTQALPNINFTPTKTPPSDPSPRVTHPRIFSVSLPPS